MTDITDRPSWLCRLAWFAALWAGGVVTVALVGLILKTWLGG